ncbi:MAG: YihY/virulence factor BrkB family protein, partial [Sphingobacteriales bacterium]
MTRLELKLLKWRPVFYLLQVAKNSHPRGFQGLSLLEVARFFFGQLKNNRLNERAAAVTYNFLMAIPPTLLFVFSLVPYLPLGDVEETIIGTINLVTPNEGVRRSISEVVLEFLHQERRDLLSFGILLTLFFSSNGMMGLIRSFDRTLPVYVKRTKLERRWTAIKLTFMLMCVAIISLGVLIIQTNAVNDLLRHIFESVIVIKLLSLFIVVAIIFCSISIIYTYGPSLTGRFSFVSPGSVFATILSVVTTTVFFFLVDNFINYNKVYGPIGTLIAF